MSADYEVAVLLRSSSSSGDRMALPILMNDGLAAPYRTPVVQGVILVLTLLRPPRAMIVMDGVT
jgi:hypothetical protein